MSSFLDLSRHFGGIPPATVASLTTIAEARGRAALYRQQNPSGLETLRQVALIQSTEASNAIENIHAPLARIEALVAEKTKPRNRSEQEIAGYRDVLATIHANGSSIPFEPRYVEQLHGYLYNRPRRRRSISRQSAIFCSLTGISPLPLCGQKRTIAAKNLYRTAVTLR